MMSFQFLLYLFQSCYHQDGFHLQKASELPLARLGFSGMPAPLIVSGVGWSLGRSFPVPFFLQSYVSTLWCRGSITMPGSSTSPSAQLAVQYTETPSAKEMWREKQTCATWKPFSCSTHRRFRWPFSALLLRKFVLVTAAWMWAWRRGEWMVWLIWLSEAWGPFFPSSSSPWFHFFVP